MASKPSPWKILHPCSADWNKMRGNDKRRFCDRCQKFVHNVSAMNQRERTAFAHPSNQHACVFYLQRTDGTVADLSLMARLRSWFPFLRMAGWTALITLLPATLTGCMGVRCPRGLDIRPLPQNETVTPSQATGHTNNLDTPAALPK
jgi:hypothetical protein